MKDVTDVSPLETFISACFIIIGFTLTSYSFTRGVLMNKIRISGRNSKAYWLLIPINIALLINEILLPLLLVASSRCSSISERNISDCIPVNVVNVNNCSEHSFVQLYSWIYPIIQFFYIMSKPLLLHLAYLLLSVVFRDIRQIVFYSFHNFILIIRFLELIFIFIISIIQSTACQESYCSSICFGMPTIYKEKGAEGNDEKLSNISHQSTLLIIDIVQLTAMCVYRIVGIVIFDLPTYTFADIASTAYNIFVMTTTA
ncbi:14830_t:CDS:2, partial [Dentiscutata heterogama]